MVFDTHCSNRQRVSDVDYELAQLAGELLDFAKERLELTLCHYHLGSFNSSDTPFLI